MSYKAFNSIKERIEIAYIEKLNPEKINELLNKIHAELKVLREIKGKCDDFFFAELNPDFANLCGESPEALKVELKNKLAEYHDEFEAE